MKKIKKGLFEYGDILSLDDLCEYLQISRTTAYKFLKDNKKIKFMKVGRAYKISSASLRKLLGEM